MQAGEKAARRKVVGTGVATAFGIAAGVATTDFAANAESADPEIMTITTTAGDIARGRGVSLGGRDELQ